MDRNALLLYLQNVRDLEVARYIIGTQYNNEKRSYENKISSIQTIPDQKEYPHREKETAGCCFVFCISIVCMCVVGIILLFYEGFSGEGYPGWMWLIMIFDLVIFGIGAIALKPESQKSYDEWLENEKEKVDNFNKSQQKKAQDGKKKRLQLSYAWGQKADWYKNEYAKLTNLLSSFYNQNILASQYRNVASVVYIYDYMSTSQASLNETLIHEHMENGIQRLEAKLDQVVNRLETMIYENRCMYSENKSIVQHQITQNEGMLRKLQSISTSSQDAAFYSQLAANYSKANAYFSLANYLKG